MKFSEFNFSEGVREGLDAMGFETATPIQAEAIPVISSGKDIIGIAQTGTGKTAAFLLPVIDALSKESVKGVGCLIVVPTRELAIQIDQAIQGFAYFAGISSLAIYGGGDGSEFSQEKQALSEGCDIVICTPGRLISHLNLGYADFGQMKYLILDEADRMLDMGFLADISKIVSFCPESRQTLLFSATMPDNIFKLSESILNDPEKVQIALSKPAEKVLQVAYSVRNEDKKALLANLLEGKDLKSIIMFSSRKSTVADVNRHMKKKGFRCGPISSDLAQEEREAVLLDFRNRKIQLLVATDVVSRGIDIDDIDLVINYDVPNDAEDYVHRIGRTARASKSGMAITFISPDDQQKFHRIERLIEQEVMKVPVPEHIGPTPEYNPKSRHGGKKRKFYGRKGPKKRR